MSDVESGSTEADAAVPEDAPARTPWWRRPWALATGAGIAVIALGIGGGLIGSGILNGSGGAGACNAISVSERALPSVVTVWATGQGGSGNGSGAVIDSDGLIVTNDHVIAAAVRGTRVTGTLAVTLADGERLDAKLVGRDPQTDLAVLRVSRDGGLPQIRFGDSAQVRTGQPVVALGAPLGQSNTVTAGIISALNRSLTLPTGDGGVTVITGALQTDAAINPGNSGGALVDCDGRLIGVNTAISTVPDSEGNGSGGSIGIGFAVPADTVQAITDELVASGRVDHPSFGIEVSTLTPQAAAQFGVPPGLVITSVVDGGSADRGGLRVGDLITRIGGQSAPTAAHLAAVTVRAAPGDEVEVTFLRESKTRTVKVTLQPNPTS
ncbi:S1C family serine protease [Microbacterium sp. NPDC057650]|uniref:S1C family serine protease n=1 Tax=unclassified Microbacterium TaxID=2609290 RepID=UPI0036705A01